MAATPSPSSASMLTLQPSMTPSCATYAPPNPEPKPRPSPGRSLPHLHLNQPQFPPPRGAPSPVISSIPLKNPNLTQKNRSRTNLERIPRLASANRLKTKRVTPDSSPLQELHSFPAKTRFVPPQNKFVPTISRAPQRLRHRLSSRKSPPRPRLPNPLAWPTLRHQDPPAAKLHPRLPPVRQRLPVRPPARTGTRHHPLSRAQSQHQPRPLQLPPRRSRHEPHPRHRASIRDSPKPHPGRADPRIQEPSPCPDHHPGLSRILPLPPQV